MVSLRARPGISAPSLGVEAPARQGARSAHTGRMKATSNAARRDASASRMVQLFPDGPLGALTKVAAAIRSSQDGARWAGLSSRPKPTTRWPRPATTVPGLRATTGSLNDTKLYVASPGADAQRERPS